MDDCGSLRCVLGELVREAEVLVGGEVVELSESLFVVLLLFLSLLRGASLIRPASLRWWSSSRLRMRSAYTALAWSDIEVLVRAYLGVVCVLGGIVEESGCMVMLVPRGRDAAAQSGRLRISHMFMGFCKMRRLHSLYA